MNDNQGMRPELDEPVALELPGFEQLAIRAGLRGELLRLQAQVGKYGKPKVEKLADRAVTAFEQLSAELDKLERAERDAARVAELKAELAQLTGSSASDAGLIREWARSEGITVPARGRVPANVVEQYREATRNA